MEVLELSADTVTQARALQSDDNVTTFKLVLWKRGLSMRGRSACNQFKRGIGTAVLPNKGYWQQFSTVVLPNRQGSG